MGFDIPINITQIETSPTAIPTRTPYIDVTTNRFVGHCTDRQAMAQAVMLALMTPRFHCIIYDSLYGSESEQLIGSDYDEILYQVEAKRIVREALFADNRVTDVYDFVFATEYDESVIRFSVDTVFGSLHEQEVRIRV